MSFLSELVSKPWSYEAPKAEESRAYISLRGDGIVFGFDEMLRWSLDHGVLDILDAGGSRRHRFDEIAISPEGVSTIVDTSAAARGEATRLVSRLHPSDLPTKRVALRVRQRAAVGKRANLVILRANERSLHPQWRQQTIDIERSWDLCVSFYGAAENFGLDEHAEYQVMQEANRKYHALADLFHGGSPLWRYEYVAFPDDDLMTSWADLNRMFEYCRRYDLLLSQPALSGYVTHPITRRNSDYILRFTSFIEPIAPWFSRQALDVCLPTFAGTLSGYGLDHVWPKLLGEPRHRLAIVDDVVVEHTRAVAQSYDMQEALAEGWRFQMAYGAFPKEVEYGGLLRAPVDRYQKW